MLFPSGRVSDVQRRMMTTPADANIHAVAIEGTFDDCQAILKALFNDHAFRDKVRLSGVNSINWARLRRPDRLLRHRRRGAGRRRERKLAFAVPTGNFGDVFAGYVAARMGLPVESLIVATNVNDILARTLAERRLRAAPGDADHLAVDGHPGVVATSSACCSMPAAATRPRCAARWRTWPTPAASRSTCRRSSGIRAAVPAPRAPTRRRSRRPSATPGGAAGYLLDPHTAVGLAAARKVAIDAATCRWWCWAPPTPPSSPTRWRRPAACAPACRRRWPI